MVTLIHLINKAVCISEMVEQTCKGKNKSMESEGVKRTFWPCDRRSRWRAWLRSALSRYLMDISRHLTGSWSLGGHLTQKVMVDRLHGDLYIDGEASKRSNEYKRQADRRMYCQIRPLAI